MFSKRQRAVVRRRQYEDGRKLSEAEANAAAAANGVRELAVILRQHVQDNAATHRAIFDAIGS